MSNDNPDAFPKSSMGGPNDMSLRDYFAGHALAGILSNRELQLACLHDRRAINSGEFYRIMALEAYEAADAMLKVRKAT